MEDIREGLFIARDMKRSGKTKDEIPLGLQGAGYSEEGIKKVMSEIGYRGVRIKKKETAGLGVHLITLPNVILMTVIILLALAFVATVAWLLSPPMFWEFVGNLTGSVGG
jgi:hypothetical protein